VEEIAEVYARALFEAAKDNDVLDRVHDELGEFVDSLDDADHRRLIEEALGEVDFSVIAGDESGNGDRS